MRYRKLHPITADMRREISVAALAKAGAFKRPMRFPFQRIETARDYVRLFPLGGKRPPSGRKAPSADPQIIAVTWRPMTFGMKPFFVCPRCQKRRVFLYFDTLQAYCRCCADLWYFTQRKHHRTRLLYWSHKLRVRLDDQIGKPGDQFPAPRYRQKQSTYRRIIAKLKHIEQQYLHIIANDRRYLPRERDERGCYMPSERIASVENGADTDDLGA
jgi:hypothetical protein